MVICNQRDCLSGQTNQTTCPKQQPNIKTNFVKDAELSIAEVKQVLELAKKLGIDDPVEVSTFYFLPSTLRGICVKSADRIEGRSTCYDTATISKDSWTALEADKNATWVGDFWANKDAKDTTLLRRYESNKETIQVALRNGVDVAFADKVIPLILSKTVQFENDWARQQFEELKGAKPTTIYKNDSHKDYELRFEEAMIIARFKMKKEKVVITGVSIYDI